MSAMDQRKRQPIEAAQTLQHVHHIADMLAERLRRLSADQADAQFERELVALAVLSKGLEAKDNGLASEVGFCIAAVIRERVAQRRGEQNG
jgi:hypothetical protein